MCGCRRGPHRSSRPSARTANRRGAPSASTLRAGAPIAWDFHTAAPALAKISLHSACVRRCAGGPLRCAGKGRQCFVSAFPAHKLVVVHFWKNVVVAEPLGIFIELLAPPDEHGLQAASPYSMGLLDQQVRPLRPVQGCCRFDAAHHADACTSARHVGRSAGAVPQSGEVVQQPGHRPPELRARGVAAGHGQYRPPVASRHGPSWPPEVSARLARLFECARQGGQGFLGVSTVAAGEHHGLGADPGRDAVVVARMPRAPRQRRPANPTRKRPPMPDPPMPRTSTWSCSGTR